jgi:hypothetical protein
MPLALRRGSRRVEYRFATRFIGALALLMACVTALAQPTADSPQAALTLIGRYAENQQLDEGMAFVPAADSPADHTLLIVGNEVSGTVAVYEVR